MTTTTTPSAEFLAWEREQERLDAEAEQAAQEQIVWEADKEWRESFADDCGPGDLCVWCGQPTGGAGDLCVDVDCLSLYP